LKRAVHRVKRKKFGLSGSDALVASTRTVATSTSDGGVTPSFGDEGVAATF